MNKILSLMLFILLLISSHRILYSQNFFNPHDICKYKVGDTLQLIESPDESIEAYLYVFADESSCITCNMSLGYLFQIISENLKIKGFVFFNTRNQGLVNKFHDDFSRDYEIIWDRIGVYANNYGIKFEPSYLLLDKYGKIYYINKLGNPNFHEKEAKDIADEIRTEYLNQVKRDSYIQLINTIKLLYDNKPLLSDRNNSFLFNKETNSYYFLTMDKPKLYKSDSNGRCSVISDSAEIKKYKLYQGYSMEWFKQDSVFYMLGMAYPSKHLIIEYDIKKQKYFVTDKFIPIWTDIFFSVLNNSKMLYTRSFPSDTAWKLNPNYNLAYIMNQENDSIMFFAPDTIYQNNRLSIFARTSTAINDKNEIILWQKCSNKIHFYNESGEYLRSKDIHLPKSFKYPTEDLPESFTHSYWTETLFNYAMRHRVFSDNSNGNIGLMYTYFISETPGKSSLKNCKKIYMHLLDKDVNKLTDEDIEFPLNVTPFYLDDNKIYSYTTVNGELEVRIYQLNL
jgi:hypothetical protein